MGERAQKAAELFEQKYSCSQAVVCAFSEAYGLDRNTAAKIACGLGGGVRSGEVCGAVTGAVLVIGLKYGDDKHECIAKTEEFLGKFRERYRYIVCRDLLGFDVSTPEGRQQAPAHRDKCLEFVRDAAALLEDLGY